MKKILLLIFILLFNCTSSFALEIVYPKKNPVKINANSTFFIGSTNPTDTLTINDIDVKVAPSGAFAQTVPLNVGKNIFKIISTSKKTASADSFIQATSPLPSNDVAIINFVIEKPAPTNKTYTPPPLLEYPMINDFYTKNDNVTLRTTPVDGGINRMSHLPKDMQLLINGEKNGFYRVYLNSKTVGWLNKSDVEQIQPKQGVATPCSKDYNNPSVSLKKAKCKLTHEYYNYEFEFERKTPFTIREENGLTFEIFNVQGQEDNTLTFNIPMPKLTGYEAYWNDNKFILNVRRNPIIDCRKPLKNITIAVDAGHGGNEAGAIGCCGDREKDINLAISKNLEQELKSRGAKVVMTREADIDVSLSERVKIAKENDATLLISIHANALPDGADPNKNKGTSVYYYHNQAKPLAESILNSMTTQLCTQNDKVRQGSLALVRPTSSVSVLIEVAYIINPDDYALLTDKCFQQNCAKAIADGIENYLLRF